MPPVLGAQQVFPSARVIRGTLSFDAKATAGDFTGSTNAVSGEMTGGELSAVRGWVEASVKTLVTGNDRRDRDLNKSMESGKYPTIRFDVTRVEPAAGAASASGPDSVRVTLHGTFHIHGVSREASFPATVVKSGDEVRVLATLPMNLKDYQIGGLSKILGLLKMDPAIVVHVDVTFGKS